LQNVLPFAPGNSSWIRYGTLLQWGHPAARIPDLEIPRVVVTVPSQLGPAANWARNPIPACDLCGATVHAACVATDTANNDYQCTQACSGFNVSQCPPGMTQFASPLPGLPVGWGDTVWGPASPRRGFQYSIVDHVTVPLGLETGQYLLSWRWDSEQSPQVWYVSHDHIAYVPHPSSLSY
jgi:hypothetical protein